MRTLLHILLCCAAAILCRSCSIPTEYADFVTISHDGWAYGDTLTFVGDTVTDNMQVCISVRHTANYVYGNLWLEVSGYDTRDSLVIDTVNIRLADKFGRWFGRGSGVSFVKTDTLPEPYRIAADKPVKVRHIMRLDTVLNIEQVGVTFIPLSPYDQAD